MAGPWERYAEAAPAAGPWRKYQAEPATPAEAHPAPPARPEFPTTGSAEEFGQNLHIAGEGMRELGNATTRTVANNLLPSIVDPPTPEQGAMFDRMMTEATMTGLGAAGGGLLTKAGAEVLKGLGRAGMSRAAAERFMSQFPQFLVQAGEKATATPLREFISPAIKGSLAGSLIAAADPSEFTGRDSNFIDNIAGATGGAAVAGVSARDAAQNLLLGNPRWRDLVMRDPAGTTGKILGGILGYLSAKLGEVTASQFHDAADYVAGLFEEQTQ